MKSPHSASDKAAALPRRLLGLITNQRSGSTWLSDAIRAHACIDYWPEAVIYKRLELKGRRYPMDLANKRDGSMLLEVRENEWERIPVFSLPDEQAVVPDHLRQNSVALEKIHPEFYGFNDTEFCARLDALRAGGYTVQCVYVVRAPRASTISFMDYQARNPHWYRTLKDHALSAHMRKTYESIQCLCEREPGPVFDYEDLVADMRAVLMSLYKYVWPAASEDEQRYCRAAAAHACRATAREKRQHVTA